MIRCLMLLCVQGLALGTILSKIFSYSCRGYDFRSSVNYTDIWGVQPCRTEAHIAKVVRLHIMCVW